MLIDAPTHTRTHKRTHTHNLRAHAYSRTIRTHTRAARMHHHWPTLAYPLTLSLAFSNADMRADARQHKVAEIPRAPTRTHARTRTQKRSVISRIGAETGAKEHPGACRRAPGEETACPTNHPLPGFCVLDSATLHSFGSFTPYLMTPPHAFVFADYFEAPFKHPSRFIPQDLSGGPSAKHARRDNLGPIF